MNHAACCYVPKLDGSNLVLGVWNPIYNAWAFPGGKVEPGEKLEAAALRELCEEAGVSARAGLHIYAAEGSVDGWMVHVFLVDIGSGSKPRTCEPGNTVSWVTPDQLCSSTAFGAFYRRFFASRNWRRG